MRFVKVLSTLGVLCLARSASSTPISGDIQFGGSYSTDNQSLNLARKFTAFDSITVVGTSGLSYSDVPADPSVTFNVFAFDPVSAVVPVIPLWTFTLGDGSAAVTYSFDVTSLTINSQSDAELHLSGLGMAHVTGAENTAKAWDLTIDNEQRFRFSTRVEVPDSNATALMTGGGLLVLGIFWRKRAQSGQ